MSTTGPASSPNSRRRWIVLILRWGLPLGLLVLGVVFIVMGHGQVANVSDNPSSSVFSAYPTDHNSLYSALGVSAIIIALMVALIGFFIRLNSTDGADRDRDEAARDYFSRTGRWPGDTHPPAPPTSPR